MNKEKISVNRALNELKLLKKRLAKKLAGRTDTCFINYKIGTGGKEEMRDCDPKANLQSIRDLIRRFNAIESAILKSNSVTIVKIGNEEMTVSEAIARKKSIEFEKQLLETMTKSLYFIQHRIDDHNETAALRLDDLLKSSFGGKEGKIREADIDAIKEQFERSNKAEFVDPLNLSKIIEELDDYIDTFENEVDLVLNESNAKTEIEVQY
jgi:hypothetical protein